MKTIEINLYTPKELFEGSFELVKDITRVTYYWNKTKSIRKPHGINWKTPSGIIQKVLTEEEKEKFIACFPEDLKDRVYFTVYGKLRITIPPGEFR